MRVESEDGETDGESEQPGRSGEGYEFELRRIRSLHFLVVFVVFRHFRLLFFSLGKINWECGTRREKLSV